MIWLYAAGVALDPNVDPQTANAAQDHFTILVYALLGLAGTIITAGVTITTLLIQNRKRSEEVKYEITNDHDKPLRDDMDGKHDEMVQFLNTIVRMYKNMDQKVDGAIAKIDTLVGRMDSIEEDTINPKDKIK